MSASPTGLEDTAPGIAPGGLTRGLQISRYVVLELVGSGAMGSVYAAYDPQLDRRVALKLVSGSTVGREATDRLLREARALAKLSHSSVVQVFDAGEHEGQVFLAMEFVEGQSLADFARAEHTATEKFAVLRSAGRGLAAAHAAGIVHRDFKPANVMVGRDGRIRVVDFGLARPARAVSRGAVESGELPGAAPAAPKSPSASTSQLGGIVGTPRYMAPEQFRGEPADARSDQFAFCVTAWELVFGTFPFAGTDFESLRAEVLAGRRAEAPSGLSAASVAALYRGLSLDPSKRFESMDALLEAFLPRTERRRVPWLMVGALVLALSAGARLGVRTFDCRQQANEARARFTSADGAALTTAFVATKLPYARETAERSIAAVERWVSELADASATTCRAEPLLGARTHFDLDRRACVDASAQQLTVLLDAFRTADAKVVENAARAVGNLPDVARCATDRQALEHPADPQQQEAAKQVRAKLAQSAALIDLGQLEPATKAADDALKQAREVSFPPLLAAAALQAAKTRYEAARFAEADVLSIESVSVALAARADELALEGAVVTTRTASRREARDEMNTWLALSKSLDARLGHVPALAARVLEAEGLVARSQVRLDDARVAFEHARKLAREAKLQSVELSAAAGEAAVLQRTGRCAEAEPVFREVITTLERTAGPSHVRLAMPLNNFALCVSMRDSDEARRLYERAISVISAVGETSPMMTAPLLNMTEFELRRGEPDRAAPYLERARVAVAALGPAHTMNAFVIGLGAKLAFARGDLATAEREFQRGLELIEKARGAGNADTADFLLGLGLCAEAAGRPEQAKERLLLALSRLDQSVTPYSRVEAQLALARIAARASNEAEAARWRAEAEVGLAKLGTLGDRLRQSAAK
ncbi:MAG: serine/threonine protein kinase [Archangium sp.]|nr:serine/threonine protein kinase [Archangium sp.]